MNLVLKHVIFFVTLYNISLLLSKINSIAIVVCFIMPIIVYINKSNIPTDLFSIIKGLSVFIPLLIYPNYKYLFDTKNKHSVLFTTLLAFNVLQPALLLALNSSETLSKLNGISLIILALLTPKLYYSDKTQNIIFPRNILWGISSTVILISTYLFNNFYYKMNWRYLGLYSIIIPTIHTIINNDSSMWLPLRAYSLALTFLITISFPKLEKELSEKINSKILWSTEKYDYVKLVFYGLELICIFLLIRQGYKDTFLQYFL